ncbi:hypothetical protein HPB52_024732 [Rhipicephalus sanguineus]|uniref:C2H2-type domain-containing protein n=1 Tax=Rhipicephalus sanguineus TaxID=34632 RepID=A0A9D4TDW8_RHISA|nr:hypothetical protein HPB52_024732 [Rhipicephalus sanguineus]
MAIIATPSEDVEDIGQIHCRVCHMSLSSEDHLWGHLRSERHVFLSKTLNVHPDYTEHLLLQHLPKAKVESLLQSLQQPATGSQQAPTTDEGKVKLATHVSRDQRGVDKQPDTSEANSSSGQQNEASHELYRCDVSETSVPTHGNDELERHFKGHQAKVEELARRGKPKPGTDV